MTFAKHVAGIAMALCIAISTPGSGLAQEPNKKKEQTPGIESVLIRLQQDKDALEDFMSEQLSPQLQKISDSFASNVSKAEKLLERIKRDPKNERLKAEYEDVLSQAITQGVNFTKGFAALRDPSFDALDGVRETIVDAKAEFGRLSKENQRLVDNYDEQSAKARQQLAELADKFKAELASGRPLPPEVDEDVRLLQVDIDMAAANAKVLNMTVKNAQQAAIELDDQLGDLNDLRSDLNVAFRQAAGQQSLLGNVARYKRQRIQMTTMFGRLEQVRRQVASHKVNVGKIGHLVTRIVEADVNATSRGKTKVKKRPQKSNEILKAYLTKPKTTATRTMNKAK